jgi:hypothetical protein
MPPISLKGWNDPLLITFFNDGRRNGDKELLIGDLPEMIKIYKETPNIDDTLYEWR